VTSGYSLLNDPEERSSQLLKLKLRINTNTWLYNLWSNCNTAHYSHLADPLTSTNLCPLNFQFLSFSTHSKKATVPPSCFIQQYSRIYHITALPLIFLGQSKQVLKFVDSMGDIWMKSQLMKNVKLEKKSTMAFFLYISCQHLFTQCDKSCGKSKVGLLVPVTTNECPATELIGSVRIPPSHFYNYATYNYWQGH